MCPVTFTALAVSAGLGATSAAVVGTAVSGALIGVASNAAVNIATGQSPFAGAGQAALFGGVTGGLAGASGFIGPVQGSAFNALRDVGGFVGASLTSAAVGGAAGSLLRGMTPDYGFTPISQTVQQQNSQNIATTGSGGRQATASLADAIKRSKKRKLTQEDVGDLSIDTSSFANTGLQLA